MMISEAYDKDVFIADFTNFVGKPGYEEPPCRGVLVSTQDNGLIPSFVVHNEHGCHLRVVNNEHNSAVFRREDGSIVTQCECIAYADRNDNRKGWMFFLELKYCEAKNRYDRMLEGLAQLKSTCNYILKEKQAFDANRFKIFLLISTPGVEPLDPFDAFYFDPDYILALREETGALLRAKNEVFLKTPAVLEFE